MIRNNFNLFFNSLPLSLPESPKFSRYTSFGIIPFLFINNEPFFILVQRKETIPFVLFVKNKFNKLKLDPQEEFKRMTKEEKKYLIEIDEWNKTKNFYAELYENIKKYKHYIQSEEHGELEWFFPKGRKNNSSEPAYITAIREFYEETQFPKCIKKIFIDSPINCFKYGTDKKKYNYVFFPALIDQSKLSLDLSNNLTSINSNEISNIGLFNISEFKEKVDKVIPLLSEKIVAEINSLYN